MARFVMANRRAGLFAVDEQKASRAALGVAFAASMEANVEVVGDHQPQDEAARRVVVFDAAPDEIAAKMAAMPPDVLLEPEILHFPQVSIPRPGALPDVAHAQLLDAGVGIAMTVWARGGGSPVVGARGILYLRGPLGRATSQEAQADASGRLRFDFGAPYTPSALLIIPPGGFWSFVVRGPEDGLVVDLPALPRSGPLAWWHQAAGITSSDADRGRGIHVGVIDTGVGPHPYLGHVARAGAFIDGRVRVDAAATDDVDSHGTHVCATIGARPRSGTGDYEGLAPGATLSCARVFPPGQGASQADIVLAIDHLSRDLDADLINMSLGSAQGSQIEQDSILDALERGTLCLCAAGNDNAQVRFPAAFDECVAVSALGREGWGPPGSLTATRLPQESSRFGQRNLYLANFSCFGTPLDCAAPGVGILACIPARFGHTEPYGAMDGTSMAAPVACGVLAALLAGDATYATLRRDTTRAEYARSLLRAHCRDIGLAIQFQGRGMPHL